MVEKTKKKSVEEEGGVCGRCKNIEIDNVYTQIDKVTLEKFNDKKDPLRQVNED